MELCSEQDLSLIDLLALLYPESSKTTLRKLITSKRVTVNGKLGLIPSQIVKKGQLVMVHPKGKGLSQDLQIVYEDRALVVIDKPPGLLSVATDSETENTVHMLLKKHHQKGIVYPIHRLDKGTSGLLVFAYTQQARDALKEQLERRTIKRVYRALVHGHLEKKKGTWKSHLFEDKMGFVHSCPPSKGKLAVTHYEVLEEKKKSSLLDVRLETGRKHQIRVHTSQAGHPVVGDKKYGQNEEKSKKLYLQAVSLSFDHPLTGKRLEFSSPYQF